MTATNKQQQDNILRWPELAKRIPFSRSHVHALVKTGDFPPPIKLGLRASGWIESEIDSWIANRIAESRNHPTAA